MIQELSFSSFCDAFPDSYKDNFTYDGKKALFDYLEEYEDSTGEKVELDVIALCCEYSEYADVEEYINNYNTDVDKEDFAFYDEEEDREEEFNKAVLEEIENKTTLIKIKGSDSFIIQCY